MTAVTLLATRSSARLMLSQQETTMSEERLPTGWNEDRIRRLIEYYDGQTDDERAAEIQAALAGEPAPPSGLTDDGLYAMQGGHEDCTASTRSWSGSNAMS